MRKFTFYILLMFSGIGLGAESPDNPSRSVLFIGNSMIGRTVDHLGAIVKAEGLNWRVEAVLKGGARLEQWRDDHNLDPFGLIDQGMFTDVIFVQGTSFWFEGDSANVIDAKLDGDERMKRAEKTLTAAIEFHEHIAAAGARTVIYMGYPHMRAKERTLAAYRPLELIHWIMKDRLDEAIIKGNRHTSLLVPNGILWILGAEHFGESVWYKNNRHGNNIALYANAILFYAYLENKDPRNLTYESNLKPEDARWIKEQAWILINNYSRPKEFDGFSTRGLRGSK